MLRDRIARGTFSRRGLHGQVAHRLGLRIVSGEVPEGALLSSEMVASAEMSVSRTAYREAIKVLAAKGLVESRPKVGTRVRPRRSWNMLDPDILLWATELETTTEFANALFEFRQIIEPAAARLAAGRQLSEPIEDMQAALKRMETTDPGAKENVEADLAFHKAVLWASGNEFLGALAHVIETLLARSFEISSRRPEVRKASVPLHEAVWRAIAASDPAAAERAMATLLEGAREDIDQVLAIESGENTATEHLGGSEQG